MSESITYGHIDRLQRQLLEAAKPCMFFRSWFETVPTRWPDWIYDLVRLRWPRKTKTVLKAQALPENRTGRIKFRRYGL